MTFNTNNTIKAIKTILVISIIFIMLFAFIACNKDKEEDMNNYTWYSIEDNTLNISLRANSTTGYSWEYLLSSEGILKEERNEYVVNNHEEGMVGVGGKKYYSFSPLKDGEVTLTFNYLRTFEENSTIDTKVITIKIENGIMSYKEI